MSSTPNYLAEAIGIADGTVNLPVSNQHLRALLGAISPVDARHFLKGEKRCQGCQSWMKRELLDECESCPDNYCTECREDHRVYCK